MNVRCGLCGNTWGCDCAAQEQLFTVAVERRCTDPLCQATQKNLCKFDADVEHGLASRTRRRPRGCIAGYDPSTASFPDGF